MKHAVIQFLQDGRKFFRSGALPTLIEDRQPFLNVMPQGIQQISTRL